MSSARFFISLVLLSGFLISSSPLVAQKIFKGRIVYNITYAGSNIDLAELGELPSQSVIVTKKNLVRNEMSGPNASMSQIKISDGNNKKISVMLDILREKYVIHKTAQEIATMLKNMPQPELEFTSETREILGYNCKRVIARITDERGVEHVSDVYYTDQIDGHAFNFDSYFHEIPGLILEYELRVGQLNIKYTAESIKGRLFVGSRNFNIPRDYQSTTYEALRLRLQGNF
jgi:GLPGLI family protein